MYVGIVTSPPHAVNCAARQKEFAEKHEQYDEYWHETWLCDRSPLELDPNQPRLPVGRLSEWRHRVNLHRTESKLVHLLRRHRFDTACNVLRWVRAIGEVPSFGLTHQQAAGVS